MTSSDDTLRSVLGRVQALFPIQTTRGSLALHEGDNGEARNDPRMHRVGPLLLTPWEVWLGLRTTTPQGLGTEGSCFLAKAEQVHDPRLAPYAEGMILSLRSILERASDASMENWAIGYFDVRLPLDVFGADVTADRVREYFLTYPWLGRLLPSRPAKAPAYVPAPSGAVLHADGTVDLDRLWLWIGQHTQPRHEDTRWDDAMTRALPPPVRVLAALRTVDSRVGGNGFEVFLAQARGVEVRDAYDALAAVSAECLRELMARGIGLAAKEAAAFTGERAKAWYAPFEGQAAASWPEIDGHEPDRSYALLQSELIPAAERYANAHVGALVRIG